MRRFLILLVILLVAGAWIGQAMVEDTGYVLIAYKQTSIETSIWVLCLATLLLFAILHLLLNIFTHIRSPIESLKEWNQSRTERKAEAKAHLGLMARAEGDWWRARRMLLQAAKTSHTPTIYYLEAAEMAARLGDEKELSRILDDAVKAAPQAEKAIQLSRAQFELRLGHAGKAEALIEQLIQTQQDNPQVKLLQAQLLRNNHDWKNLYPLIGELIRNKAIDDATAQEYRYLAGIGLLQNAAKEYAQLPAEQLATELRKSWNSLSFETQQLAAVRIEYLQLLLSVGKTSEAIDLLSGWLGKSWNEELLLRFSELDSGDPNGQLKTAKSWLKQQPNNAALELCLARLSQRAQLWGAAIQHYKRSLELETHAQTLVELSQLYLNLGEQNEAAALMQHYNQPLHLPAPNAADRETRKSLVS